MDPTAKKTRMISREETAAMGREGVTVGLEEIVNSTLMKYYELQSIFQSPNATGGSEKGDHTIDIPRSDLEKKLIEPLPVVIRLNNNSIYGDILLRQFEKLPLWKQVAHLAGKPAVYTCSAMDYHSKYPAEEREWISKLGKCGRISFQELVSLVPVLLLQVKSDHYVLDMCSAPGSKCCALAELMNLTAENGTSTGLIIANDISLQRCTHDLARKSERSHCPNIFVLNGNAFTFPPLFNTKINRPFQFDRIMADVPCSGDGTMRKNPSVWQLWDVDYPMRLHKSQLKILLKGLQLLKPGGILTYSTCSLNPLENEAVVAEALHLFRGLVKVINTEEIQHENMEALKILKPYKGLTTWRVPCPKDAEVFYETWDDVPEEYRGFENEPQKKKFEPKGYNIVHSTMFPKKSQIIIEQLPYCLRYQPNNIQNDCGCFFVAVLTKIETTSIPEDVLKLYEPKDELSRRSRKKQFRKIRLMKELEENRKLESHDTQPDNHLAEDNKDDVNDGAREAAPASAETGIDTPSCNGPQLTIDDDEDDDEEVPIPPLEPARDDGAVVEHASCSAPNEPELTTNDLDGSRAPNQDSVEVTEPGEATIRKQNRKDKKKIKTRRSDDFVEQTKQIMGFQVPYYGRTILNTLNYCNTNSFEWRRLSNFYGMDESKGINKLILAECNIGNEVRKLSICTEALYNLSLHCIPFNNKATFIAAGLPFMKRIRGDFLKPAECRWRPCQEAVPMMLTFCNKRVYQISIELTISLLRDKQLDTLKILEQYPDSKELGGCILVTFLEGKTIGFACTSCGAIIQLMASDDYISTSLWSLEFALKTQT